MDFDTKQSEMIDALKAAVVATYRALQADPDVSNVNQITVIGTITLMSVAILERMAEMEE